MRDSAGRVPLHCLCLNPILSELKPRHVCDALRALVRLSKKGASSVDMYGCTALHYLCMRGKPNLSQLRVLLRAAPAAAATVDVTGRTSADSIWLNIQMPERLIKRISEFLEKVACNASDLEDAPDSLHEHDDAEGDTRVSSAHEFAHQKSRMRRVKTWAIDEGEEDEDEDGEDENEEEGQEHCAQEEPKVYTLKEHVLHDNYDRTPNESNEEEEEEDFEEAPNVYTSKEHVLHDNSNRTSNESNEEEEQEHCAQEEPKVYTSNMITLTALPMSLLWVLCM